MEQCGNASECKIIHIHVIDNISYTLLCITMVRLSIIYIAHVSVLELLLLLLLLLLQEEAVQVFPAP